MQAEEEKQEMNTKL